jgi:hypothetical protein
MRAVRCPRACAVPTLSAMTTSPFADLLRARRWTAASLDAMLDARVVAPPPVVAAWAWAHIAEHDRAASAVSALCALADVPAPAPIATVARRDARQRLALLGRLTALRDEVGPLARDLLVLKGTAHLGIATCAPGGDLDLCVPPAAFAPWCVALEAAGYTLRIVETPARHCASAQRAGDPVTIDLHARWFDLPPAAVPGVWARRAPVEGLPAVERPCDVDLAWHLLVHGTVQHADRLGQLNDAFRLHRLARRLDAADHATMHARIAAHAQAATLRRAWEGARTSVLAAMQAQDGDAMAVARQLLGHERARAASGVASRLCDLRNLLSIPGRERDAWRQLRTIDPRRRPECGPSWWGWIDGTARMVVRLGLAARVAPSARRRRRWIQRETVRARIAVMDGATAAVRTAGAA